MRYEIGQKVPFIHVAYNRKNPRFGDLYLPWEDQLEKVTIKMLTCQEHHRVPGEWDDEIKYDGFIFKDADSKQWNNQYPRAAYGQLSTENDYRVFTTDLKETDGILSMDALSSYMENILYGLNQLKVSEEDTTKQREALSKFYDELMEQVNKEHNLDVCCEPFTIGDKTLAGRFTITFEPKQS